MQVPQPDAGEASALLSMLRVLGLALAVAVSTSMVATIDDHATLGTGLRVALLARRRHHRARGPGRPRSGTAGGSGPPTSLDNLRGVLLPDAADAPTTLAAVLAAFAPVGGLDELQRELLRDVAEVLYGIDLDTVTPTVPEPVFALSRETRHHIVHLLVVLEFMEHPLRPRWPTR